MLEKLKYRLLFIYKNNLLLLRNLLKCDCEVRYHVLKEWIKANIVNLNPFNKWFQNISLYLRIKKLSLIKFKTPKEKLESNIFDITDVKYINLESRKDRNIQMINEFNKLDLINYSRFDAVNNNNGALGCSLSHKFVIEQWYAKKSRLLMICEDDASFNGDLNELEILLSNFYQDDRLDVLCLGYNHFNQQHYNDLFYLTSDTVTTSCYVLKPHMKEILINNINLSIKLLRCGIDTQYKVGIDQVWTLLQKKYFFVIPKKRFAYQRESFSNISNKYANRKV